MNKIVQDSEQGFKTWLDKFGWIDVGDDYYEHKDTGIERSRVFLHGLYIAETKLKT